MSIPEARPLPADAVGDRRHAGDLGGVCRGDVETGTRREPARRHTGPHHGDVVVGRDDPHNASGVVVAHDPVVVETLEVGVDARRAAVLAAEDPGAGLFGHPRPRPVGADHVPSTDLAELTAGIDQHAGDAPVPVAHETSHRDTVEHLRAGVAGRIDEDRVEHRAARVVQAIDIAARRDVDRDR